MERQIHPKCQLGSRGIPSERRRGTRAVGCGTRARARARARASAHLRPTVVSDERPARDSACRTEGRETGDIVHGHHRGTRDAHH